MVIFSYNAPGYGLPKRSIDRIDYKIAMAREVQKEWGRIPKDEQALYINDIYGYTLDVAEELGCYAYMVDGKNEISVTPATEVREKPQKILNDKEMIEAMEALRKCNEMAPRLVLADETKVGSKTALAFYMRELNKVAQCVGI